MKTLAEPKSEEKNGVVFFENPWVISLKEWFSLHDDSDFVADKIDDDTVMVYCYAKDGMYNAELEKQAKSKFPQKVIYNGMGVTFGGIWL